MNTVFRSEPVFAIITSSVMLTLFIGSTLIVTVAAKHSGMCGNGDFRPPCGMFAVGICIYAMIAVTLVSTLVTLFTYAARRRPPVLLKWAAIFTLVGTCVFWLPIMAAGNKLAGAFVVIIVGPFAAVLLGCACFCIVAWVSRVTSAWLIRRAVFYTK